MRLTIQENYLDEQTQSLPPAIGHSISIKAVVLPLDLDFFQNTKSVFLSLR